MKNMGIDHGGHHVAVRQQLLGRADIIRELQQVNGERSRSEAGSSLGTYGKQLTRLLHLVVGRPALLQVSFKSIDHEHLEVHV